MQRKILIVEDDEATAIVMSASIQREMPGFDIQVARRLSDALEAIKAPEPPHAIILDLTLLDADREQTLSRVSEFRSVCPVAIVTGHTVEEIQKKANDVPVYEKIKLASPGMLSAIVKFAIESWRPTKLDSAISRVERLLESHPHHDSR